MVAGERSSTFSDRGSSELPRASAVPTIVAVVDIVLVLTTGRLSSQISLSVGSISRQDE